MMEDRIGYSSGYATGKLPPPVVSAINSAQRLFEGPKNKHELYDAMSIFDDAVYTALQMKASLIRSSYRGLYLKVGSQRTFEEDGLIRLLSWIEEQLDIEQKFFDYGEKLCTYGDWVVLKDPFSTTPNVRSLPIKHLTILENEEQLDNSQNEELEYQVFKRGLYVLNERNNQHRLVFSPDQIIHMSLNLEGSEVSDTMGRFTYEVWGKSPLEALKTITLWKHNTILNDILIRHRIVPRELHGLNFEDFDDSMGGPSTMPKNQRKSKVRDIIEGIMQDYEGKIVWREPDQAYIYDKNATEISMLSPTGFKYAEPNQVIDQQNQAIARVFGIPITVFGGSSGSGGGGSFASDIVRSSFTMARTPDIARVIKKGLITYIKEYIETYFPYYSHLLERVDIRIQLVMDKDLDRLYKVATVMSQMVDGQQRPLFTPAEIREIVGKEPLTEQDYIEMGAVQQQLDAWGMPMPMLPAAPNIKTPGQTVSSFIQSNPQIIPHPKTDASKDQQQWATQ